MSGALHGWRRALRVAGWNVALLAAGLALLGAVGEIRLRATRPFAASSVPRHFVPEVGYVYQPGRDTRHTNHIDFWTIQRTNRLGFADREPIDPARAAASCHVTAIGDSFVAAIEVPIADKFHVRLEAFARRALPHLNITTSAFGLGAIAPVNELAFWDHYARRLRPRLLVLVLSVNDLWGNSPSLSALESRWDPDHLPFVSVRRAENGTLALLAPDPAGLSRKEPLRRLVRVLDSSYLLAWLRQHFLPRRLPGLWATAMDTVLPPPPRPAASETPPSWQWYDTVRAAELPPEFEEALALLGFVLDQFVERTRRDGAALAILATHEFRGRGDRAFGRLRALAAARGIPVVNQHDYIVRRGGEVRNARWPHDGHWNAAGHQWAAEALLQHLRRNPEICGPRA